MNVSTQKLLKHGGFRGFYHRYEEHKTRESNNEEPKEFSSGRCRVQHRFQMSLCSSVTQQANATSDSMLG